jgi:hypothetical protein
MVKRGGQRGVGGEGGERERETRETNEELWRGTGELPFPLSTTEREKGAPSILLFNPFVQIWRVCASGGGGARWEPGIWVGEGAVVASGGNRDYGMGKKGFFLSICCCLLSQLLQCCFSHVFVNASTGAEEVFRGRPEQGSAWELPIRPSDCDPYTLVTNPLPPPPPSPSSSSSSSDKPTFSFVCVCVCVVFFCCIDSQ